MIFVLTIILAGCYKHPENEEVKIVEVKDKYNIETQEQQVITFMHHFNQEGGIQWIVESTNLFTEKNPNALFNIQTVSSENYNKVLRQRYASGNIPDIYVLDNVLSDSFYIDCGFAVDLTDMQFIYDNIKSSALRGGEYKEKIWCLPLEINGYGVVYNRDIFTKAGIHRLPATRSEFIQACQKISSHGVIPIAAPYKDSWTILADIYADMMQSSYLNNTDWRVGIEKGLYLWSDNFFGLNGVLERLAERSQYFNAHSFDTSWTEATKMLAEGQAAMIINGTSAVDAVRTHNKEINIGMFAFPWSEEKGKNNFPLKTTGGLVANAKSPNVDTVINVLEHFSTKEIGRLFQKHKKSISVVKELNADFDPAFVELNELIKKGKKVDFSIYKSQFDNAALNDLFTETLIRFLHDKNKSVEDHIEYLDEETAKIMHN